MNNLGNVQPITVKLRKGNDTEVIFQWPENGVAIAFLVRTEDVNASQCRVKMALKVCCLLGYSLPIRYLRVCNVQHVYRT